MHATFLSDPDVITVLAGLHRHVLSKCWPGSNRPRSKYDSLPKLWTTPWVSYDQLEARVKHDRVVGTKSSKALASAMFLQVRVRGGRVRGAKRRDAPTWKYDVQWRLASLVAVTKTVLTS